MKEHIIWDPKVSVGPFHFNDNIENYTKIYELTVSTLPKSHIEIQFGILQYTYDYYIHDIQVFADSKKHITCISCHKTCCYRNVNIIGLTSAELFHLLDQKPDEIGKPIEIGNENQIPIEYYNYEAQIWISESTGIIRSIYCSSDFID